MCEIGKLQKRKERKQIEEEERRKRLGQPSKTNEFSLLAGHHIVRLGSRMSSLRHVSVGSSLCDNDQYSDNTSTAVDRENPILHNSRKQQNLCNQFTMPIVEDNQLE